MPISAAEAKDIATAVVEGRITEQPWFYITLLSLTFLASAGGAFLSAYLKKRGQTLATKADFDSLQEQLRRNTHLAEDIKADVQSRYSEAASVRALLRERTEALVMATFELEQWMSQAQGRALRGDHSEFDGSPMSKISALHDIYFPEVVDQYAVLRERYLDYVHWLVGLQRISLESSENPAAMDPYLSGFNTAYRPFFAALGPFRSEVIASARARGGL